MTKEITKAIILQEIEDRFKLREFEAAKFLFAETVIPVYNIEEHLAHWTSRVKTVSVTATGGLLFLIVPDNQRWYISSYDVIFMTGVYTIAGLYLDRVTKVGAGALPYMDLAAAQSVSYHAELKKLVRADPGDTLNVNVDGFTSTGDLRLVIDCVIEEIR